MSTVQPLFRTALRAACLCVALLSGMPFAFVASALPPGVAPSAPQEAPQPVERPAAPVSMGSSAVSMTNSMDVLDDVLKLRTGDRVSFRIVEDRREPILLYVTDSGEVEVPLIGRVKALDRTCKQLAYEIKPRLEKEYFKNATVIVGVETVSPKSRGKVMITGQIRQQGMLEIMPDDTLTLSKAILRSGGLADFANKRKVKLVRRIEGDRTGRTETTIHDLVEILEKGHLEKDPELKPGDLIIIPERTWNF